MVRSTLIQHSDQWSNLNNLPSSLLCNSEDTFRWPSLSFKLNVDYCSSDILDDTGCSSLEIANDDFSISGSSLLCLIVLAKSIPINRSSIIIFQVFLPQTFHHIGIIISILKTPLAVSFEASDPVSETFFTC